MSREEPEGRRAADVALMRAMAAGDREALGAFYERNAGAVMGLCMRILSNRSEAEETVADVFVELWERAERYQPERGSPLVYLMSVTRSRAIDRVRRRGRHANAVAEVVARDPDPRPGPRQHEAAFGSAVDNERRAILRKALDVLDPPARRVVELSFFRGLTHREIAADLNEPIGTVKTRIRRGLIRLRDELRAMDDLL